MSKSSDSINAAQQTDDGGYILAGTTHTGASDLDGWLVKSDTEGNQVWSQTFTQANTNIFNDVQQTTDGGYILAGCTGTKDSSGIHSKEDGWVVKTGSNGEETWSYTFGGKHPDEFNSVLQTSDGGYILGGWASSTTTAEPIGWLVKLKSEEML